MTLIDRGLDYSWGRPRLGEVVAQGYRFVSRYLSYDQTGKNITPAERDQILAAGLELSLNWQWRGDWQEIRGGAPVGREHATEAVRQAKALGYPAGCTIYYSIDFDAQEPGLSGAVTDYIRAAAEVTRTAGYRMGAYGGYRTIQHLFDRGLIDDGWQTYAWSGGQWDPRAALRQVKNNVQIAGAAVDINERHGVTYLMGGVMPAKSLAEIVRRAETIWPLGAVPYSMASTKSPTGHRQDCSGYASACLGLPPPGESTVTLVTKSLVRPLSWEEMRPGDLVGRMGPGTEGAAGHVMVVTGVSGKQYTVLEQKGGTSGPVRGTYKIGGPSGYKPYRSVAVTEEDDMPLTDVELSRIALYVLQGSDDRGYPPASLPKPVRDALADRNVSAQLDRLGKQLEQKLTAGIDYDKLAAKVAPLIRDGLADAVADKLAQRLRD